MSLSVNLILERLASGPAPLAFLAGDYIADIYHFGRVERISPEAPVPIFIPESRKHTDGGAGNVFNNLQALGLGVVMSAGTRCSKKTRYMAGHHLLLRVDEDQHSTPSAHEVAEAIGQFERDEYRVLVISDYAKGWITKALSWGLIKSAMKRGIPVVVDPKGSDWSKYAGATVLCPNAKEWGLHDPQTHQSTATLITLGAHGASLLRDGEDHRVRSFARQVFDVTGAGDTVVAIMAAVLAAGGDLQDAAELAMVGAGFVVGEIGTAVCSLEILATLLKRGAYGSV